MGNLVKMETHEVIIKAKGSNGSGKSRLLKTIRDFLEPKGFSVKLKEHEMVVTELIKGYGRSKGLK